MPRRKWRTGDFKERLIRLRKARGLTQVQLAKACGSTQRAISYYENESTYPPAPIVAQLARALNVSTDELLGSVETSGRRPELPGLDRPELRRLWKTFQRVLELPEKDQRAVVRLITSLVKTGPRSTARI